MSEVIPYKVNGSTNGSTPEAVRARVPHVFETDVKEQQLKENDAKEDSKDQEDDKKPKETDSKGKNVTTSFSFDQVNSDADELIELRGEGRYFGVTDPSSGTTVNSQQSLGPLCANCHKRGHIRAKCKTVVCHKCGVVGEHYESQCPTTMICSRCGEKGHMISECTSKTRKRQYCKSCDTFSHGEENCPSIWRSYLTHAQKQDDESESSVLPVISCYNCASSEHYGDECFEIRSSRVPNFGSAFSGSNLPVKYRPMYFHQLKRSSANSSKRDFYNGNNSFNDGFGSKNFSRPTGPTSSGRLPPKGPAAANFKKYGIDKQPTRTGYIKSNQSYNNGGYNNGGYNNGYNNQNYSNGYNNQNSQSYSNGYNNNNYNNNSYNNNSYNNSNGYNRGGSKPTRSGMIDASKAKKQKKNIRNLY